MSNNPQVVMRTPAQLENMTPAQRNAYLNSLPAAARTSQRAALNTYIATLNRTYMRTSVQSKVACPQTGGSAYTQAWAAGSTLYFTVPSGLGQFCEGVRIDFTGTLTPAAGTSAVYALNAASPYSLFDYVTIQYGNTLHRFRPYVLPTLSRLAARYNPSSLKTVLAGNSVSWLQNWLNTGTTTFTVSSANTWTFRTVVPFTWLGINSGVGLIPVMGGETPLQVQITCAPTLVGYDPITNLASVVSGTGHAVAVAATVAVVAIVRNGDQYLGLAKRKLDLAGQPTTQIVEDQRFTGFAANVTYRPPLSLQDAIWYLLATFVDGVASTKFSSWSNFNVLGFAKDSVGSNHFWTYGTGSNLNVQEAFTLERDQIEQDTEEGIYPYVWAPTMLQQNPTNYDGLAYLSAGPRAWVDARPEFQLATVTPTNITPRVEFTAIIQNPVGLTVG